MLRDLRTSLFTPCSPYLRRMGYLDEAIAMRKRFNARRSAWQPHLEHSKRFILSSADRCKARNTVVILGSGLLLDVPLAELSALFRHVVLMDVICLPEIRKQLSTFPNAVFVEHDVTAVSEHLYQRKQQGGNGLPPLAHPVSPHYQCADLVVSLNILSQLWVIPRGYALSGRPSIEPELLDDWCAALVTSHYSFLRSLTCPVCLVADHKFVKRDREGAVISSASTVYDLELPLPESAWTWNIAPLGTESDYFSKELNVGAWLVPG